jgi:SAM-dependent methyltransferase
MTAHGSRHDQRPEDAHHDDDAALGQLLELDAEVLHSYLSELTAWLGQLCDRQPRHIADLGSGTGTGALALAHRFPSASVTAIDLSPQLLQRLSARANALGLSDRVHAVQADLDADWPPMPASDLIWAASSLHHLSAPDRALAHAFAALRPGGLLAVTEMDFFPRFLPEDAGVGRPGLESRIHAALNTATPAEWSAQLIRSGFVLQATRPFVIDLTAPLPPTTGRYAWTSLRQLRSHLTTQLPPDDLTALDTLLDADNPLGVLHRGDLTVRTTRTTWVARRE